MDKNLTVKVRDLVEGNTTYASDDTTGVQGYYEPFIKDNKVGFHFHDFHGRITTIYLEPCDNETLVWVHLNDLDDEESSPDGFLTLAKDWPAEGWQATLNGEPKGIVHNNPGEAELHADGLRNIHPDATVEVVSAPFDKE